MFCAEWWSFEVYIIMAGNLGVAQQASQVILFTYNWLCYCIPQGMQQVACSLIGNCIGANNLTLGKRFLAMTVKINAVIMLFVGLFTLFAKKQIVSLCSEDAEVIELVIQMLKVLALIQFFDGMQTYFMGPI